MTGRERLLRTYRHQPTDRVPVRLVDPEGQPPHPSYGIIWELARKYQFDVVRGWNPPQGHGLWLSATDAAKMTTFKRPSSHEGYEEEVSILETPAGELRQMKRRGTSLLCL